MTRTAPEILEVGSRIPNICSQTNVRPRELNMEEEQGDGGGGGGQEVMEEDMELIWQV